MGVGSGANGKLLWSTPVPQEYFGLNAYSSPVVGSDGSVYITTLGKGFAGSVFAFDGRTGAIKWQVGNDPAVQFLGPTVSEDGTLYVAKGGFQAHKPGVVAALDSTTGVEKWSVAGPTPTTSPGPPTIGPDGTLYVLWTDYIKNNECWLCAMDGILGTIKWSYRMTGMEGSGSPPALANGHVYFHAEPYPDQGNGAGRVLTAIDQSDGEVAWSLPVTVFSHVSVGSDGTLYLVQGQIYAVNPFSGMVKWSLVTASLHGAAIGPDERLYTGGMEALERNKADGSIIWRHTIAVRADPVVAPDKTSYFVADQGIFAFDTDGKLLWRFTDLSGPPVGSLSVAADGTLYIVCAGRMNAIASKNSLPSGAHP